MSLCQAINTYFGIVMSADKRIMTTVGSESTRSFLLTDNAMKLFLTKHSFGVSYCGAADIDGIPTEYYIERFVAELAPSLSVEQVAIILAKKIKELHSNNIILIVCGFYKGEAYICSNSTDDPDKVSVRTTYSKESNLNVTYAGGDGVTEKYYKTNKLAFDYQKYTLKDATQFLSYINYSVASELHFAQEPQNVSFDCDILIITRQGAKWSTGYENLLR